MRKTAHLKQLAHDDPKRMAEITAVQEREIAHLKREGGVLSARLAQAETKLEATQLLLSIILQFRTVYDVIDPDTGEVTEEVMFIPPELATAWADGRLDWSDPQLERTLLRWTETTKYLVNELENAYTKNKNRLGDSIQ